MLAKILVVMVVVAAAMVCEQGVLGQIFKMEVHEHGEFLEKIKPAITKVSKTIADAAKGGEELEHVLIGVISKDLVEQMKKLSEMVKGKVGNGSNPVFYVCRTCTVIYNYICKCPACIQGTICLKYTCGTKDEGQFGQFVDKITFGENDELELWSESSKAMLKSDVTRSVFAITKSSDSCCTCSQCRQKSNSCAGRSCCADGDDCVCDRCSDSSVDLIASSIWNPLSLTQEVEQSIDKVNDLVDMMGLLMK